MEDALLGPHLLQDLADEQAALDAVVADLPADAWDLATASPGWRVRDQIGHLAFFDEQGTRAAVDPAGFEAATAELLTDMAAFSAAAEALGRTRTGDELVAAWRARRADLLAALAAVPEGTRLPWYGPPMSVRSFATARLMETWAHGQDVVDALDAGAVRPATDRLRHVCHIGFGTFAWSWRVRGEEPPAGASVRVELELPSGASWTAGDDDAADVVRGDAEDFCLVVTQRRNVAATSLQVVGDVAAEWMAKAQCFAGGPTLGPAA
jgi:uncharacterized protein (TIGR03084 family)